LPKGKYNGDTGDATTMCNQISHKFLKPTELFVKCDKGTLPFKFLLKKKFI